MMTSTRNIYSDERFEAMDIGAIMRVGHPDIEDGDNHILDIVLRRSERSKRPLRVLDLGAGSGHLSWLLARRLSDVEVIANEIAEAPARQAKQKLCAFANARVFDRPFEEWREPVSIVISWGSHHHLSHDYLRHVQQVLEPDGVFIVGDELCPEYLTEEDRARLDRASSIEVVGGYIFDSELDIQEFRTSGRVPEWNRALEDARRKALWKWYKFVGDYAIERQQWGVLVSELQIARDDLITEFAEEHKTSPYLLERELALNGFEIVERAAIGPRRPEGQSCVVYTCRRRANPEGS